MTERLCTWDDANSTECGKPTPEYLHLYEEWGQGQIGCATLPSNFVLRRLNALVAR
jgi:hypothetical protein